MTNVFQPPRELRKTVIVFHISSALYFLLGLIFLAVPLIVYMTTNKWGTNDVITAVFLAIFVVVSFACGIFVEIVISQLKKGKRWAWIAGLIIAALYVTSLFLPLGVIGLVGLLNARTMSAFHAKK